MDLPSLVALIKLEYNISGAVVGDRQGVVTRITLVSAVTLVTFFRS